MISTTELIVKQQLDIENLKNIIQEVKNECDIIHRSLYSIGAPLNDNVLQMNEHQRLYLHRRIALPLETIYLCLGVLNASSSD